MSSHPLWASSLPERLRLLRPTTTRIAFISPTPGFGTFRYRCFNPVESLNTHGGAVSASYFFLSDLATVDDLSDYADVLVVSRIPWDAPLDRLYRRFRNAGKTVLFDVDDLIVDTRYAPLVAANLGYQLEGEELNQWTAFISNIGRSLKEADGVVTSTAFLAQRIRDLTTSPVHVIPNTLNTHQVEVSRSVTAHQGSNNALRIAYFSGSPSHALDFDVARVGITEFLRASPQSTFTVVGHLELPEDLTALTSQVSTLPFMDFLEMQRVLAQFDVNIVPLQSSDFTHSKSELKYFEAAAVATLTLASRGPVFEEAISHGTNGFLADDHEWRTLLGHIQDLGPTGRQRVAESARAHALEHYSPTVPAAGYRRILEIRN